jgi:hypothetical protein
MNRQSAAATRTHPPAMAYPLTAADRSRVLEHDPERRAEGGRNSVV